MAKLNGPLGSKLRGKVGEVVAAKTVGGDTAIRAYQPVVKNPNTLRQRVSRNKMAAASQLAAVLAEAIGIGYAKATASAKMYPRNMFMKGIIPVDAAVMTLEGETPVIDYTKLPVSKGVGITEAPVVSVAAGTETGSKVITATNAANVTIAAGETLGLVVVGLNATRDGSIVRMGSATTGVTLSADDVTAMELGTLYAFFKVIPEAYNGVASTDIPWKYPSDTSACKVFTLA